MKKILTGVMIGMTLTCSAFAQSVYVGVEGGAVAFKDETDDIANTYVSYSNVYSARVEQDAGAVALRPFVGVELTENIALEFGLMSFSQDTSVEGSYSGGYYKESWERAWRTVDFSALLRPAADSELHGLFARVGGHSTKSTYEFKSSLGGRDNDSETKSGALFGLGYDWFFGESRAHHALRLSFTHYDNVAGLEDDALNILSFGYFYKF